MELVTFSELKTRLGNSYDISDETWVTDEELVEYINEAIDDIEGAIHSLHYEDKYFLTSGFLTLVQGQQDIALPTDIYGNKIRHIFYQNGTQKYEILKFRVLTDIMSVQSADIYRYLIFNDMVNKSPRVRLYPAARESSSSLVPIFYIRNMAKMTTSLASTNVCELPEGQNYVSQHVRYNLAKKTRNPTLIQVEKADRDTQYALMQEALKEMTPDANNQAIMDLTHYVDTIDYYGG